MNIIKGTEPSQKSQKILSSLEHAVDTALEKKRKLGQYAIVWDGGKVVRLGMNSPEWHDDMLAERTKVMESGAAEYLTVEELKKKK